MSKAIKQTVTLLRWRPDGAHTWTCDDCQAAHPDLSPACWQFVNKSGVCPRCTARAGIYLDGSGLGARELKAIKALIVAGDAQRARQETERAITEISRVLHGLNAAKGALEAFEPVLERIGGRSED